MYFLTNNDDDDDEKITNNQQRCTQIQLQCVLNTAVIWIAYLFVNTNTIAINRLIHLIQFKP